MKSSYVIGLAFGFVIPLIAASEVSEENWTPDRSVAQIQKTTVHLQPKSGADKIKGKVDFVQQRKGVKVTATIEGLEPNSAHGFHIHENPDCSSPDAKSAGDHFNPTKKAHGSPENEDAHHTGDLGNLRADKTGRVSMQKVYDHLTMDSKSKESILNRSIVLHAKADDLKTQPSGDSGDRIGCGVIKY